MRLSAIFLISHFVMSCTILPTLRVEDVEYCEREPGTNYCKGYVEYPDCSIYDLPEECEKAVNKIKELKKSDF